jgi:DNA-binding LacI/PurR family transcriptional regulator
MKPRSNEVTAADIDHARHRSWLALGRKRPTIAVLTDNMDRTRGGYESSLRYGFQERCRELGIHLAIVVGRITDSRKSIADPHNELFGLIGPLVADGVVLLSAGLEGNCGVDLLRCLCPRLHPLPLCSVGLELPNIPSIVHDGRVGMVKAVEHVLGHHARRRVLYLHGIPTNADAVSRLNVCREVMSRYGLTLADSAIGLGNFTLVDGYRAARTKFEQDSSFDAIIAANDGMALGALDALRERGIIPGSNVSVTGFDDMTDARFSDPPLTTVSQPLHQMAHAAIDLIAAQWIGKPLPAVNTIESDFVVRNSCGCGQYEIDLQSESILAKDASLASFFAATSERLAASIAPRLGYSPDASLSQARLRGSLHRGLPRSVWSSEVTRDGHATLPRLKRERTAAPGNRN